MSYQVFARKWRPQVFDDVVGQEHVLQALANSLSLGRIHHAYLLSGTRGIGKTTIARLLAKGLNCETGITARPCGKCKNCSEIEHSIFLDMIEIDAASRTKVEDTRELLDNIQYVPYRGRFKIYLIDEVHMLSRHSFNTMLKALEEPPAHVKFLLATTDPQKIPITILSRCLHFHLKALDEAQIINKLKNILQSEHIEADQRALQLLARSANGSMRDALNLADQAIAIGHGSVIFDAVSLMLGYLNIEEQPLSIIENIVNYNGKAMFAQLAQCASYGMDWDNLMIEMLSLLHRIAIEQMLPDQLHDNYDKNILMRLRILAQQIQPADLQKYYQIILIGRKELTYAPDRRMGVEMTMLRALVHLSNRTSKINSSKEEIESNNSAEQQQNIGNKKLFNAVNNIRVVCQERIVADEETIPNATTRLLQERRYLLSYQHNNNKKVKNYAESLSLQTDTDGVLERLGSMSKQRTSLQIMNNKKKYIISNEYSTKLEHEVKFNDKQLWAAQAQRLQVSNMVKQLALNSWKEELSLGKICLHLRSAQRHLNSTVARNTLCKALSADLGIPIELMVVEDDDKIIKTPLELMQTIYEKKMIKIRNVITKDTHIKMLLRFFDAELDDDSIRPI